MATSACEPLELVDHHRSIEYFDVVLVGKTGFGKSETGNKLLKIKYPSIADSEAKISESTLTEESESTPIADYIQQWKSKISNFLYQSPFFKVSDPESVESTTKQCQLLSNEYEYVRVLDMPGFADTEQASARNMTVYNANLALFRRLLHIQKEHNIQFNRLAYFLPVRGAPGKADAYLQEELKIMYYFFGRAIFDIMVIIATNDPDDSYQAVGFNQRFEDKIKRAFLCALHKAVGSDGQLQVNCPPIIYIPLAESGDNILRMLREAPVPNQRGLVCEFVDDVCSKCAVKFQYIERESSKLIYIGAYHKDPDPDRIIKCHPMIIPKHSKFVRFIGQIIGVVVSVSPFDQRDLAYFSEEICKHCGEPPGSPGCLEVGTDWSVSPESTIQVKVEHKNRLEEIQVIN